MGMIDELIQQHCPDGIKYKRISEFATVIRGGNFQKKDFVQSGKPCIHYGQIYTQYGLEAKSSLSFVNEVVYENSKKAKPNNIIMAVTSENVEDIGKCLVWMGNEDIAVSGHTAIIDHELNGKYLAYFFSSEQFYNQKLKYVHGTKVMEITPKALYDVVVPIPPLAVGQAFRTGG